MSILLIFLGLFFSGAPSDTAKLLIRQEYDVRAKSNLELILPEHASELRLAARLPKNLRITIQNQTGQTVLNLGADELGYPELSSFPLETDGGKLKLFLSSASSATLRKRGQVKLIIEAWSSQDK